ncbi:hypothetical protein Q9966_003826 [Columba livia]|nr:hypothetical protein Q9966_003826 [Columba livia]
MCRDPVVVYRTGTMQPGTRDTSWTLEEVHELSHQCEGTANFNNSGTANFNDLGAACQRKCAKRLQHRTRDLETLSALG